MPAKTDPRRRFVVTVGIACAAALLFFLRHPIADLFGDAPERPTAAVETAKERRIKHWVAPMDPNFVSDKPGKSPMGMDLVPVYEDDGAGSVTVDAAAVQNIGVATAVALRRDVSRSIRAVGSVAYDESTMTRIQSKVEGWIEKLYVNTTGRKIARDTILLEIYAPALVATQEEFLLALDYRAAMGAGNEDADRLYEASLKRLRLFDVPEHQIDELIADRIVKKTLHIHSPFDGVIIEKNVNEGMQVKPGATLFALADLSRVWVVADLYETELRFVKAGQTARLTVAAWPGEVFTGTIDYVYPYLDTRSRTMKVRLIFPNREGKLAPGMYGDVTVDAGTAKNAVTVVSQAILRTGRRDLVYVETGPGRYEPRQVTAGLAADGYTVIEAGVSPGEKVVTSSHFLIDAEAQLKQTPVVTPAPTMDHSTMKPAPTDHSTMDHGDMDHSTMDHGDMDHSTMEPAPTDHAGHGGKE
jgi:Cu(I)/Ag(I) efflux system membrane fusion protein